MVKAGDTIIINKWFGPLSAGDELTVAEVDSDGTVWVDIEDDQMGFEPDEYTLAKRNTSTNLAGADVETFQRNQTDANLRSVFE